MIVTSPSPADIWQVDDTIRYVQQHKTNAVIQVVFNKVRSGTVLGRMIDEMAQAVSAPALAARISDRECYKLAMGEGWKALDLAAQQEVLQLAVAILSLGR